MGPLRTLAAIAVGVGFAWGAAVPPSEAAFRSEGAPDLVGVARDAVGSLLVDVEILVLSERPATEPIARGTTGADGRFVIGGLPPGTYRIAALKEGYLASLSRVNTFWGSALEVVLRPIPHPVDPGTDEVLGEPQWMLRLPRRSLLREVDLASVLASSSEASGGRESRRSRLPDGLQGEFVHRVALAQIDDRGSDGSIEGTETRMELASLVGSRANLRVQGERESLAAAAGIGAYGGGARQRASSFSLDVSVEAGGDSSLDLNAFYDDRTVALDAASPRVGPGELHGQRAWGYDATWATQLDAVSRLAVQMDFVDQALAIGGLAPWTAGPEGSSNRALGAETSYEAVAGEDHLIRLGVRAQRVDLALPFVRGESAHLGVPGATGWSVALDVEDAWSLAAGGTIVYGLGLHQTFEEAASTSIVPRVGGAWTAERFRARGIVSYHGIVRGGPVAEHDLVGGTLPVERPFGYEIEVESPGPAGWTLLAGYRDWPVLPVPMGLRPRSAETEFFVTNGQASERRAFASIDRAGSSAAFSLKLETGDANGLIAESVVFGLPYRILADREVEFHAATAAIHAQRTGTNVAVRFVRVGERRAGSLAEPPTVREYVDAEFIQDLVRFGSLDATCRLVLAARMATGGESERDRTLLALERRLSAGLALAF